MEIVERGDIFFLYRPRVGETDPESLSDVQRFFVVLRPEHAKKVRLLVVGRKRLPDAHEHERKLGFRQRDCGFRCRVGEGPPRRNV